MLYQRFFPDTASFFCCTFYIHVFQVVPLSFSHLPIHKRRLIKDSVLPTAACFFPCIFRHDDVWFCYPKKRSSIIDVESICSNLAGFEGSVSRVPPGAFLPFTLPPPLPSHFRARRRSPVAKMILFFEYRGPSKKTLFGDKTLSI